MAAAVPGARSSATEAARPVGDSDAAGAYIARSSTATSSARWPPGAVVILAGPHWSNPLRGAPVHGERTVRSAIRGHLLCGGSSSRRR